MADDNLGVRAHVEIGLHLARGVQTPHIPEHRQHYSRDRAKETAAISVAPHLCVPHGHWVGVRANFFLCKLGKRQPDVLRQIHRGGVPIVLEGVALHRK